MCPLVPLLTCALTILAEQDNHSGYLWQPAFALDTVRRTPAFAYQPQPGDLFVANTHQHVWKLTYRLALSGPPTHSGMVVRMHDGQLALMEAGIGFHLYVELSPLVERLRDYPGDVYVRRRITPLTDVESKRLTEFTHAVYKKRVPPFRFVVQVTPLRSRGPFRTEWLAKPHGIRNTYTCSELAVEAGVAAGIMDAATARPAATYPRDLFFDHSSNRYLNQHFHLGDGWHPPSLWTYER